jgi:transcriptional regulator with XRE-family HTH domain
MFIMLVKIIEQILKARGVTAYRLARDLGLPNNQVVQWRSSAQKTLRLDYLCALREYSGMSWDEFGKLLDREFHIKK